MYLARKIIKKQTHYYIRDTYQDGTHLKSRDVFDLGTDPSAYILYPGGNGYYFDEVIEEALEKFGLHPTQDDLDDIFWEFLDPEIQRVVLGFQRSVQKNYPPANGQNQPCHIFDKRRIHFLRFGRIDQRDMDRLPDKLFNVLCGKSRDEVEQYFLIQERILRPRELKKYVYTIFNLEQYFEHVIAAQNPQNLNQEKMDDYFIQRICQLNEDDDFWSGMPASVGLQSYLIKYAIMYFDHEFFTNSPLQAYLNAFRNCHRDYRPPEKARINMVEAASLFETPWPALKKMDIRSFRRLYRKLTLKHHPDQGGDQKRFIRLTKLYEGILKKKKTR
jgi:hypothetical protein